MRTWMPVPILMAVIASLPLLWQGEPWEGQNLEPAIKVSIAVPVPRI